ncbi:MAG: NAD kinase [Chitinophagales bacterium]|jgi:NAD+ kinase|nr:NAD kinase [Chitinophagales bacterium]
MIALFGKTLHPQNIIFVQEIIDYLTKLGLPFAIEKKYGELIKDRVNFACDTFSDFDEIRNKTEILISLGGDGTILEALTFIKNTQTPILGINFGRLGFLANVGKEQIHQAIDIVARGKYLIDKRSLLELNSNKPLFGNMNFALNEMTIQRKDQSSMITVKTFLNGELLNAYWADGLIISTPTGSTGYSLSCGGPILYPTSGNFVITPVAPHNLNVRPIVVSDDVILSFEVSGRGNSFLCTLDSRFETIDSSYQIAIKKAPFTANLVRLTDMNFISSLKNKLNWGIDQRN